MRRPTWRIVDELRSLENSAAFTQTSPAGAANICPGGSRPGLISVRLNPNRATVMTAQDFRRIALSFEGAEESSHMGQPDFRVEGKIFATLASEDQGYGNLKLLPEQQAEFVEELPQVFIPIPGGWGKMGMTHIRLSAATEDVLTGALRTAWKLRDDRNAKSGKRRRSTRRRIGEP